MIKLPKLSHDDFEEARRLCNLYKELVVHPAWEELKKTAKLQMKARERLILEADVEQGDAVKKQMLRGERFGIALLLATPVTIIEEAELRLEQYREQENLSGEANPPKPDSSGDSELQRPGGPSGGADPSDTPFGPEELALLELFRRAP